MNSQPDRRAANLLARAGKVLLHPFVAIVLGLAVGAVVILIADENPLTVYEQMFAKSFFGGYYLLQSLTRSIPIIVCSLAVVVAWRAGYINLGAESQMIAGGFVSTIVAVYMPGPVWLVMTAAVAAALLTGALISMFSAFIFDRFNVSIVISTLMMNYIVSFITSYFITFPLRDQANPIAIQSREIPESMRFARVFTGNTFNYSFAVALLLVAAVAFVVYKTNFGYESKMTGLNRMFASYGGIKRGRVMYSTMALSGMLAAAAGFLEIFGVKYRFTEGMFTSTGYAWTGLMAALISSLNAFGSFVVSIFLAGMQVGGSAIQRTTNIPLQVSTLIQATITLFVSVRIIRGVSRRRRQLSLKTSQPVVDLTDTAAAPLERGGDERGEDA